MDIVTFVPCVLRVSPRYRTFSCMTPVTLTYLGNLTRLHDSCFLYGAYSNSMCFLQFLLLKCDYCVIKNYLS